VDEKQRKAERAQREQLLTLVNGWDPIGRLEAGAPRDEYDWVIDKLLGLLSRNPPKQEIVDFLEREIGDHFGKKPKDAASFASKAVAWFQMASTQA